MSTIRKNYLIKKRNVLNEVRANNMTLQELRFFSIYLSKINAKDISTRVVRFSLSDFQAIMELDSRIKIDYMKKVTDSLLCKVVNVPTERGGYTGFQLFKECKVDMDDKGEWYVEIDAHDKALPLMFEFQSRFFSYQLWNALRLRSSNQLRMYEILKQYEKIGSRVLGVDELKELLGIDKKEYALFNNFKKWVHTLLRAHRRDNIKSDTNTRDTIRAGRRLAVPLVSFLCSTITHFAPPYFTLFFNAMRQICVKHDLQSLLSAVISRFYVFRV